MRTGFFISLVALLYSTDLSAQSVSETGAVYERPVRELVENVIRPIVASRPRSERRRLERIRIQVLSRAADATTAVAINGDPGSIAISDGFIHGLYSYAEALLVEKNRGISHFREWYFSYYLWRLSPVYEGPPPKTPGDWSNTNVGQYGRQIKMLVAGAMIDVLLHELGHHATDAFYGPHASRSTKHRAERRADEWATSATVGFLGDPNVIGRMIAVGYVFELNRWTRFSGSDSHPPHADRVAVVFAQQCGTSGNSQWQRACEMLRDDIAKYLRSGATEQEYRDRVAKDEGFASFPLGSILMEQSMYQEACKHFKRAFEKARVVRALVYLGWCYENGHLTTSKLSVARTLARVSYQSAANQGFLDAKRYLENLRE